MTIVTLILMAAAADSSTSAIAPPSTKTETPVEEAGLRQLLSIRRVYVDRLTGGETAAQMRDMLVSSLEGSKLFVITENQERADAFLRGAAEDLVFTDVHSSSEGINARTNLGTSRSARGYNGIGSSDSVNGGLGIGETESSHIEERKHEAVAAVRLVNKDGDVIWSTTQESQGGKFHRASTDVADRITKKLIEDYERAKKLPAVNPAASGTSKH
ncbi:MAG TPA: hypothetical protein VGY66_29860 [Gemmataceae bacterium]|nr:hypothetical protein [Gemmataceae bacterium]